MSSIPLSNEKISFTASLQEGWSGGQGSGDKSRAVKPDFPGLAREQKVLTTDEAFSKPLYLHPIETVNKTLKNQGPTTRGTMNDSHVVDNFRVSANYIQNGSSEEKSFFQDSEAKKEGSNNNWFVANNVKWPAAGTVSFYAYAPYNYNNVSSLKWMGVDDVTKNKTIHYEVPTKVEDQPDFIVAKSEGKSFTSSSANTPVALNFSHALTAITFSVSNDMEKGKINSIKIEGVKGVGDYNLSTKEWSVSSSSSASYKVPISAGGLDVGTGTVDLAADATLMMIPQTLGDDAKVTINITPTGKSAVDLTFKLNGTHWDPGNHVTYLLSTTKIIKLNMGSVTYPKWQTADGSAFTSEKLKDSYANGDELGMYIVDKNHKVVKANVQLTTTDGNNWNFSSSQKFNSPLSYDYFLYYPYQADGLAGAPKVGDPVSVKPGTNQISASDFFSDAITKWGKSLKTDQGDDGKFNSCDLQIGKGELTESSSTVAFPTMTHAMGLSNIILGKAVINGITYETTNNFGPSIKPYIWGGDIIYASAKVIGYKLFKISDYEYVSIVKSTGITVLNTAEDDKDGWKNSLSFSPKANCVLSQTAINKRKNEESKLIDYEIKLGDIYYNDGSISHNLDKTITDKHYPVGIIVYLAKDNGVDGKLDYWVETNTKNADVGGHGLVMCLKNIDSTGSTDFGRVCKWSSSDGDTDMPNVTSKSDIENSKNKTSGSGYTMTAALFEIDSEAATAAKNYNTLPAPSSKCTGWFLPSAGQYYAAMSQLGGGMSSDWEIGQFFGNMKDVTTKINDKLKIVGDSKYTEFFQGHNTWAWTSSEYSSISAVEIDSGVDDTLGSGAVRFFYHVREVDKTEQKPVRPFLAF